MIHMTTNPHNQTGSILAVSLFMLLILTVLGISGLGNAIFDEKITSNTLHTQVAFQTAESATSMTFAKVNTDEALKDAAITAGEDPNDDDVVTDSSDDLNTGNVSSSAVVIFMGRKNCSGCTLNIGSANRKMAYGMEIQGTGTVAAANVTTSQGAIKGPYPFAL